MIRKAEESDLSRIAEISVFVKRMNYRDIFNDDEFSFNTLRVVDTALSRREFLDELWVYEEDNIVKAFLHISDTEIKELYVDHFFQCRGIGAKLVDFAVNRKGADRLWVLEKNERAVGFYERNGFVKTSERRPVADTGRYVIGMITEKRSGSGSIKPFSDFEQTLF